MRRIHAALVSAVGVVSTALGLLFLVAARGHARRLAVAVVGVGLGLALVGLGVWLFRRLERGPRRAGRSLDGRGERP